MIGDGRDDEIVNEVKVSGRGGRGGGESCWIAVEGGGERREEERRVICCNTC